MQKLSRLAIIFLITLVSFKGIQAQSDTKSLGASPVIVELYTSEGCSSCPPADEAMIELQAEYRKLQQPVYFIAFHVDYWNYLGWKDPFSSASYTARQREYGRYFSLNSIYTPQTIINGKLELVGSKKEQIRKYIDKELTKSAVVSLIILPQLSENATSIIIKYTVDGNATGAEIHFMLIEKLATTNVRAGENAGSRLDHINIVKQWQHTSCKASGTYEFKLDEKLDPSKFKLVAFIQSNADKSLLAASEDSIN
jgi:hypothetical protein